MKNETQITASVLPTAVVDRHMLKAAIDKIRLVVENRNTMPVLSNVKLSAEAGDLVLTATDLDIEISVRVPGEVDGRMATSVPAAVLQSVCSKAPKSDKVTLMMILDDEAIEANTLEASYARIEFGKTTYRLNAITADDFPVFPVSTSKTHRFNLPGSTFWNALDSVKGAISTEETRYYMNGIYLAHIGESLRAVATDGHRLYAQNMAAPKGCEDMPGVIIPQKVVGVLHKLLKAKDAPTKVAVRVNDVHLWVTWENVTIKSKLVDGTFPDYARVIPTGNDKVATLDTKILTEAVNAVSVIMSDRGRAMKLAIAKGLCTLSVNNPDTGSADTEIGCDYDDDAVEIGFNVKYMLDMIANACPAGGDIVFKMADAGSPTLVVGEQAGWAGVLMPMRV